MFITYTTKLVSYNTHSCLISNITHTKPPHLNPPTFAKKKDSSEDSSYKQNKPTSPLSLFSTKKILIQSAVGVFALGFIDAGYSGDWSRIGVISRGTEDLLKTAAFLVVPFCIYVIFYLSKGNKS
ncbi:Unknown protein [Striga hermonthica]|uniref:DUF7887 domain-containing protein n=1 Tax=Striga hermonthica TaxID=68872 RepID=A0A9N7MUQ2_STRHE|nr:Unknown protein [Striga hermonthica]